MGERLELRAPRDEDVARLVDLHNAGLVELGDPPLIAPVDVTFEWTSPGFDRDRHARVALLDDRIVGSADVFVRDGRARIDGFVGPAFRGCGVGTALTTWAVDVARAEPGTRELYLGAPVPRADAIELIEAQPGFRYARSFYKMEHRAPASAPEPIWPDGIGIVRLEGEELARAAVDAHDGSFIDHWNYSEARLEDRLHWISSDPDHHPDLWLIAKRGSEIAGFAMCFMMGDGSLRRGIVGQLGTSRPFRGIGLGRALLCESLRRLAARGVAAVELGVDAENPTGALQLYRSTGFDVVRENRAYCLAL